MRLTIISRFGRTDARRGGGIHKTAKLTSAMLKKKGVDVVELADKLPNYDLSSSDITWVYCADYNDIFDNILMKMSATNKPVIINSGWIPKVGREKWMKEVLDYYSSKFPKLSFSVWTEKAAELLDATGFEGKVVFLPHLQSINLNRSTIPNSEREGICIGELGKLSRRSLSNFRINVFLRKLFESGYSENVYAYAQYSDDTTFLGEFASKVTLIEKLDQQRFFDRLSGLRFLVWMTDKETFAAPPVEIASFGVVPVLPEMPQSLSEYLPNAIFYNSEEAAVNSILMYSSLQDYEKKSEEVVRDIAHLSLNSLSEIFYRQLLKL